jgi:predicted DCC family thiol-disulfide oxidoreductase YuxK
MYVVTEHKRYGGIDAVRYLTRRLPLLWWLVPILHIPGTRGLWGRLYRTVASRRYWFGRVSCENEVCSLK